MAFQTSVPNFLVLCLLAWLEFITDNLLGMEFGTPLVSFFAGCHN
jgi:hypothetical protein